MQRQNSLHITSPEMLEVGDILFTTQDSVDSLTPSATHVMIVVEKMTEGGTTANVAHAICDERAQIKNPQEEYKIQNQRLAKTSLPPGRYTVLRLKDRDLAEKTAALINKWTAYLIPFDDNRVNKANKQESNILFNPIYATGNDADKNAALKHVKEQFNWDGLFRAIKFAARANTTPIIPVGIFDKNEDVRKFAIQQPEYTKGMFCSNLIVTAIQSAALLRGNENGPLVNPIVGDTVRNVSNKNVDFSQLDDLFRGLPSEFTDVKRNYLESKSVNAKTNKFAPALVAWNFKNAHPFRVDYSKLFYGLDVSAKFVMPETLLYAMASYDKNKSDTENHDWLYCNKFVYTRPELSPQQKQAYQAERSEHFNHAIFNRHVEAQWLAQLPAKPQKKQPYHQPIETNISPQEGVRAKVGDIMLRELDLETYYMNINLENKEDKDENTLLIFNLRNLNSKDVKLLEQLFLKKTQPFQKNIIINLTSSDTNALENLLLALNAANFKNLSIHLDNKKIIEMQENRVTTLDFSNQTISNDLIKNILELINKKNIKPIKSHSLHLNSNVEEKTSSLNHTINLDFQNTLLQDSQAKMILDFFTKHPNLCQDLNLNGTKITENISNEIKNYLQHNGKSSQYNELTLVNRNRKSFPELHIACPGLSEKAKNEIAEFNSQQEKIMRIDFCEGINTDNHNILYNSFYKLASTVGNFLFSTPNVTSTKKDQNNSTNPTNKKL